jgi:hypothetical protein
MPSLVKSEVSLILTLITFCLVASCDIQKNTEDNAVINASPPLLIMQDRTQVGTAEQWQEERREEILELFQNHVYGKVPDCNPGVSFKTKQVHEHDLSGRAVLKEVRMLIAHRGDTCPATILIYLPVDISSPVPVFMGLNFYGNQTISKDRNISLTASHINNNDKLYIFDNRATEESRGVRAYRWPLELILEQGYGFASIYYGDFDPDFDDGFRNGVHGLLDPDARDSSSWGAISAWAWGLSRAMDYFETDSMIDQGRIALIGHSRLGKTALWAGAMDERFALVISNNSGCGGAALSRRKSGERLKDINTSFPHWFAMRFHAYNGREEDLPVDQHMLLALIAPRPLYVASAENDDWADPRGEYLSLFMAGEVYRLFSHPGLDDRNMPPVNSPVIIDRLGYHIRSGDHDLLRYDWENFLDFANRHFKTDK